MTNATNETRINSSKSAMTQGSKLEEKFLQLFSELAPNISIERQFKAIEGRKFRFDFCIPDSMVLIEIQGGTFSGGRHTRGLGYAADCEKSRLGQMAGYDVLCYTGKQINTKEVQGLVDYVLSKRVL